MSKDFDPVEYGWKVHDALDAWTTKVDSKASIVLAVEAGTLALIASLAERGRPLASLHGQQVLLFRIGIGLLVLSVVLAGASVIPQLRRRASRREWNDNSIYFGHLRHWEPDKLAKALRERDERSSIDELARQHVRMAAIAWRKHSLLQISMAVAPVGVLLVFVATL
jgi:hypothetical protein